MKYSVRDPVINTKALNAFELYEPPRILENVSVNRPIVHSAVLTELFLYSLHCFVKIIIFERIVLKQ
jgi:hypothetical protein